MVTPLQFPVEFDVDETAFQPLERQLSDTADTLQDLTREQTRLTAEIAKVKEAGEPYAELETRLRGIRAETERNMGILREQHGTYEATATGGVSAFTKVGIALVALRWGLKAAQYGVQELELRFDKLRQITGGRMTAGLRRLNRRIDQVDNALGLARNTVLATRVAMAAGAAAITLYAATMTYSIGKIKAWSKELIGLRQNALVAGESMLDMSDIMRAAAAQGLDISPSAFRQFAELRDQALRDATSQPAQAYAELNLSPGASLGEVMTALSGITNELDRGQVAMAIFGKELGSKIALVNELSDAEKNANAARIAATREVQEAGDVWRRVGQAFDDIPKGFLAKAAPEVKRFGDALLPILQDLRLWVTYSPAIKEFIGLIETTGSVIASTVGFFSASTDKQREYLRALDEMQMDFARRQSEAMAQWKRDSANVDLTSQASQAQAEAAGKSAAAAEIMNTAIDNSDNVLRSILPVIECGAEALAESPATTSTIPTAGQPGFIGPMPTDDIAGLRQYQAEMERQRQAEVDTQLVIAGINPQTGNTFASEQPGGAKAMDFIKSLFMIGGNPIDVGLGLANQPQLQSRNMLNPERINPEPIPIGSERPETDPAIVRWYRGEKVGPIPGAYQLDIGPGLDLVESGIKSAQGGIQAGMNWGWDFLGMERGQEMWNSENDRAFGTPNETIYYDNSVNDGGDTMVELTYNDYRTDPKAPARVKEIGNDLAEAIRNKLGGD